MLYQLSYTPNRDPRGSQRALPAQGPAPPLLNPSPAKGERGYLTTGSPIHVPPGPVNTRWVAGR